MLIITDFLCGILLRAIQFAMHSMYVVLYCMKLSNCIIICIFQTVKYIMIHYMKIEEQITG